MLRGGNGYRAFDIYGNLGPTQEDPGMALKIMRHFGGEHHLMPLRDYSEGEENCYALTDYKGCKYCSLFLTRVDLIVKLIIISLNLQ